MPKLTELLTESNRQFYLSGELTREKAAHIWFVYCERLARAINQANLTPEETIEASLNLRLILLDRYQITPTTELMGSPEHWDRYLTNLMRDVKDLGLPIESAMRNSILLDLVYAELLAVFQDVTNPSRGDYSESIKQPVPLAVAGGPDLIVREIDLTTGYFQREGLRFVGKVAHLNIIAETDVRSTVVDFWLEKNQPILENLLSDSSFKDLPWRTGLEAVSVIYLSAEHGSSYAIWAIPGVKQRVIIVGIRKFVRTPDSSLASLDYDLAHQAGIYTHEGTHIVEPQGASLSIMELRADHAKAAYLEMTGHGDLARELQNDIATMEACLRGKQPLSTYPEIEFVVKDNFINAFSSKQWQELFATFDIVVSDNPWGNCPPPPPPPPPPPIDLSTGIPRLQN